jgi:hypothetical protein
MRDRISRKQRARQDHFGEHDAHREQIAAQVELGAQRLFRRHVADLAFELARVGAPIDERAAHDAEVGELHLPCPADQDVSR